MSGTLEQVFASVASEVLPIERLTVSQAAEKYRRLNNPGSYTGPWKNATAPYLVDVADSLTSYDHTGTVFVAPAQTGKTDVGLNWMLHTVMCDPMNFMFVEKTQSAARSFTIQRLDKMMSDSPAVGGRIIGPQGDNVHDKRFKSGILVLVQWPTITNLSGRPIPRVFLTDYDRFDQDVGGEGSPYDLARGRITTFGQYGMVYCESSPSYPIADPRWTPATPHEAPPCGGVLSLYNRGDRRRWYWVCVECDETFEPDFKLLKWPDGGDAKERAEQCWLECPHCGAEYSHDPGRRPGKHGLNAEGFWLVEGQRRLKGGEIIGEPRRSSEASFWVKGPAAAFKTWGTLVENFIKASEEWEQTGAEEGLKATVNIDQGMPYLPKVLESARLPEEIKNRSVDLGSREVPEDVRFLVASIDVQRSKFVWQVHGIARGGDIYVIDRDEIRYSLREDENRPGQYFWVNPGAEATDWRLILREILLRTYPLVDGSGRRMAIKATVCDSGGADGVTANAYAFWRWLRSGPQPNDADSDEWQDDWTPGLTGRFALYKGDVRSDSRVRLSFPESTQKGRASGARGEIPVLLASSNMLKDQLSGLLDRESKGTGRIHFPNWLPMSFFRELCVEVRGVDGKWVNPKGYRNESWDLLVMALAVMIEPRYIGSERIDWSNPPDWAAPWHKNPLVSLPEDGNPLVSDRKESSGMSWEQLAERLG